MPTFSPHVDPAVVEALLDDGPVVVAHGGQGLVDGVLGLLVGDDLVRAGDHGGVDVVHVELVHPQQLLAQADIAVELVQVAFTVSMRLWYTWGGTRVPATAAARELSYFRAVAKNCSCLTWAESTAAAVLRMVP